MPKQKKTLFEIILVPALAAFCMGLVPIGLLIVNNWASGKKEEAKEKPDQKTPRPSGSDKVVQNTDGKKESLPAGDKRVPVPPKDGTKPKPEPTFQARSSPTDVIKVDHGKVEVTAQLVAENRIIIAILGKEFGNDLAPLQKWIGQTGDLFQKKMKELGVGEGSWNLTSSARSFTVRDGVASLDLTFERK